MNRTHPDQDWHRDGMNRTHSDQDWHGDVMNRTHPGAVFPVEMGVVQLCKRVQTVEPVAKSILLC